MEKRLVVTSPAFEKDALIPIQYTGWGEDISPEIHLSSIHEEAKSLVIIMDDMGHPISGYNHWVIWNISVMQIIPPGIPHGARVSELNGAIQGRGYGKNRYRGPKPPFNWNHSYQFHVFALDCMLNLSSDSNKSRLLAAMQGHILQEAKFAGYSCKSHYNH